MSQSWWIPILQDEVSLNDTVLDLGCGIMGVTKNLRCLSILGVDVCEDYLNQIKGRVPVIWTDARFATKQLMLSQSFDVVLAIDFIEHLDRQSGLELLDEMSRVARKKAIVFTPEGFIEQKDGIGWAQGKPEYQSHKSGWTADDFKGWRVRILPDTEVNHIFAVKEVGL